MPESSSPSSGISQGQSESATNSYAALAAHIRKLEKTDSGARAALARMSPDQALRPHEVAALAHALLEAGLEPDRWQPAAWQRWALIAHGMALAGHDGTGRLGAQLAQAGVAESRVTKLLTARGDAFVQLLPSVLRLLASKNVVPNWHELGPLVRKQDSAERKDIEKAEEIRLNIAKDYFSAKARKAVA